LYKKGNDRLLIKKIDAFATEKSDGNPVGYILFESLKKISDREMFCEYDNS